MNFRAAVLWALLSLVALGAALIPAQTSLAATARSVTVTGLHVSSADSLTQVQFDVSAKLAFKAVASADGRSITITAPGLAFSLATGAGKNLGGFVQRIRYGKSKDGQGEIVIDTARDAVLRKSFLAVSKQTKHYRVTLLIAEKAPVVGSSHQGEPSSEEITGSLPVAPVVAAGANQAKRPTIVIDAGHGGIDPGAVSASGALEKDVVLSFAQSLRAALSLERNFDVVLTREGDTFLPLQARVDIARRLKADLFVAIHADTVASHNVHGTTVYLLSDKASDAEAEALAQKENRSDTIGGLDVSSQDPVVYNVLFNLTQRESKNRAAMFAELAVEKMRPDTEFTGKALRSAGFAVLKAPDVPSVLIELGYLSNSKDEQNLQSATWRDELAKALSSAIADHFTRAGATTAQTSP